MAVFNKIEIVNNRGRYVPEEEEEHFSALPQTLPHFWKCAYIQPFYRFHFPLNFLAHLITFGLKASTFITFFFTNLQSVATFYPKTFRLETSKSE